MYDEQKMRRLIRKDVFLASSLADLCGRQGMPEAVAIEVVFNTYVLGDSVMERQYAAA